MSCWALWQRLPPRYQLSARETETAADVSITNMYGTSSPLRLPSESATRLTATDTLRKGPLTRVAGRRASSTSGVSSKHTNCGFQGEKDDKSAIKVCRANGKDRATIIFTARTPRPQSHTAVPHTQPAFPHRESSFLANFKQQQRINSARQSFADPSTTPPASPRRERMRYRGSQFPVTRIDAHARVRENSAMRAKHNKARNHSATNNSRGSLEKSEYNPIMALQETFDSSPSLSVNTLLPANNVKPFLKNPIYSEPKSVRYVLKAPHASSVIIDDDKVLLVQLNRAPPKSIPPSRENSASSLSNLKRLYLKDSKDFPKPKGPLASEKMRRRLLKERLEYDQRTGSILDSYSHDDDLEIAIDWASAVEFSRRPKTTQSNRAGKSSNGARSSRLHKSPPRSTSAMARPNTARLLNERANTAPTDDSPRHMQGDWNNALAIKSQSSLHERQFYLRTPARGHHGVAQMVNGHAVLQEGCACPMCYLETEAEAIGAKRIILPVAQLSQDHVTIRGQELANSETSSGCDDMEHVISHVEYEIDRQAEDGVKCSVPEAARREKDKATCKVDIEDTRYIRET